MLELTVEELPAPRRLLRQGSEPPFLKVDVVGHPPDMLELRGAAQRAAEGHPSQLPTNVGDLHLFRSDRGLQVVLLDPPGLLVCGDSDALEDVARAGGRCAARRSGAPYHVHLELHDWYGTTDVRLGELTLHDARAPALGERDARR